MITRRWMALPLLAFAALAQAEVYKWVDDKGKTHFSDHSPEGTQRPAHVEVLHGIPKAIQDRIRDAAYTGIDIDSISGDGRQCLIRGEGSSHQLVQSFIAKLSTDQIGETQFDPNSNKPGPKGPERFELHVLLNESLLAWAKQQP